MALTPDNAVIQDRQGQLHRQQGRVRRARHGAERLGRAGFEHPASQPFRAHAGSTAQRQVRTAESRLPATAGPQQLHDTEQEQAARDQRRGQDQGFFAEHLNH